MVKPDDIPTPCADLLAKAPGVLDLDLWQRVRLTERALGGDVDAAIEWLRRNDPQWREAIDAVREAEGR